MSPQRWIEPADLEDPEIRELVGESLDGLRGDADGIEHDPALQPTAGRGDSDDVDA